ncbi:MAG TPA: cytochrome P450 [Polyangium sp.]|nr:cytochrome P450 [Polyangium sp.]
MSGNVAPIPGYPRTPIIGNRANTLRFFADPVGHMFRLEREYGSIASFTAGDSSLVCAFGAENNRFLLSDPDIFQHFLSLPFSVPDGSAATRLFKGILSMNGTTHRRCRRLLTPVVGKAATSSYSARIVEITEHFANRWPSQGPENFVREMHHLTLRVSTYCLFGAEDASSDGSLGHLGLELLKCLSSPWTIVFPVNMAGTAYARFLDLCTRLEARLKQFIYARLQDTTPRNDVLSTLIRARDEDGHGFTEEEIIALTISMLFGGQDPLSNTLSWTLLLLAQHPQILADVQAELDGVLRGATPTENDLPRLSLLDAVVHESMRIFPAISHLIFRRATESIALGPYQLPPGSLVVLSPLVTHRDHALYPNPKRFHPERWTTIRPSAYEYMPFGAGPRMCIGAGFSAHVLRLQLATILRRFHPVLPPQFRVDHLLRAANLGTKAPIMLAMVDRRHAPRASTSLRGTIHELVDLPSAG